MRERESVEDRMERENAMAFVRASKSRVKLWNDFKES